MTVINLGQNRWSKLGTQLGSGISRGLAQAIEQARQRNLRKQRIKQQYNDLQSALSSFQQAKTNNDQQTSPIAQLNSVIETYQPQTKYGMQLLQDLIPQMIKSEQPTYERGKPFVNAQNQRVVPIYDQQGGLVNTVNLGKIQTKQPKKKHKIINYYDKSGIARSKRVPISDYNNTVAKIIRQGGFLEKPEDTNAAQPTGRLANLQWIAKQLGYNLKNEEDLNKAKQVVNSLYGRGLLSQKQTIYSMAMRMTKQQTPINGWASQKEYKKELRKNVNFLTDQFSLESLDNNNSSTDPLGLFK